MKMRNTAQESDAPPLAHTITVSAERIGVSRSEVYNILNRGELRAKKLGRRTVILHDDLSAYLRGLPDYTTAAA